MGRGWLPEDRAERIGLIVSGGAHALLILWALLGGIFFTPEATPTPIATSVSLISSKDFAALEARKPTATSESPAQPSAPEASVKPPSRPAPEVPPEAAKPVPPVEEPAPEVPPEVQEPSPVETEVTDAPPEETQTPTPDSLSQIPDTPTDKPQPKAADIVAPDPTRDRLPDTNTAPDQTEATTAAPSDQPPEEKPTEEAAPQDTGEVLVTEANRDQETRTAAPAKSPRPMKRPEKTADPAPQPEEVAAADTPEDQPPAEADTTVDATDAVAEALAAELAGDTAEDPAAGAGTADQGPPMTSGEMDAMKVAVNQCWNLGAVSTDATRTVITVTVTFSPDGKPQNVELVSSDGPSDQAVQTAFGAARRAILRCAKDGYPLPAEKYETWKVMDMVFENTKGIR